MNEEELKNKCKERAKIFQQAMESCHSSSPIDCIEWFADRIAELEKDKQYFSDSLDKQIEATLKLQQENEELDCQNNRNKFCYSCANATERCFKNEIGCPCEKYKSWKEENAELKEALEGYKKIAKWCDDCKKIKELEEKNHAMLVNSLKICNQSEIDNDENERKIAELEEKTEKLIDFVLSKTECCDICPITDTCNNSEGTCPYAGILSKGEEAVTREWLMQKIAKEIKEK